MIDRCAQATRFLATTDWATAQRQPLAGDASNRRYERLVMGNHTAVLMDAPAEKGEDVRPFMAIAEYLTGLGLSAPRIIAQDVPAGFLLLEDLGDDLVARVTAHTREKEGEIYAAATDALIALHKAEPPDLPEYDPRTMADLACLALSRYAAGIRGHTNPTAEAAFRTLARELLARLTAGPKVLIQRDYHAENLLWLPEREGVARIGMLDFQDAMLGHPAYDLVSLLQDARRDVSPRIEEKMIARYVSATGSEDAAFRAAYAALGMQRNLRIIGVFARLSLDQGKPHYVDMIPRVWKLLQRDLQHPALAEIATFLTDALPAPEPAALIRIKPE